MLETHIYIEISSRCQMKSEKKYGYIMECSGKTKTKGGSGSVVATYHRANLIAIIEAINRFTEPCEIYIHTKDKYVLDMMEINLDKWAVNDFINAKGKPVINQKEWIELWKQSQKHLILTVPGKHPYSSWLLTEMRKGTNCTPAEKEDTQNANRKEDN